MMQRHASPRPPLIGRHPPLPHGTRAACRADGRPHALGAVTWAVMLCGATGALVAPQRTRGADAPATTSDAAVAPPAAFEPQDISIGEPISLPSAPPLATPPSFRGQQPAADLPQPPGAALPSVVVPSAPGVPSAPRALPRPASPADAGAAPVSSTMAAGAGWLGMAVDDAVVTGRLVVVEVAPGSPAAQAGVRPQETLLAINGSTLQTGDELAAAFAAIAPGQQVRMAVGRGTQITDVVAIASPRPPEALTRDWQSASATPPVAPPRSAATAAAAPRPTATTPPQPMPDLLPPPAMAVPQSLAPQPSDPPALPPSATLQAAAPAPGRPALGVRTVPVDPDVQSRFRLHDPRGAFVIGVVHDLPAARAGVPPGSVIVAINRQPVRSPQDLSQLVARGPVGTPVPIEFVLPGGQARHADVVLQSLEQPLERALVGGSDAPGVAEPPTLQATPQLARRVQPASAMQPVEPQPLARLEDLLRRMNARLEQIERRLETLESSR